MNRLRVRNSVCKHLRNWTSFAVVLALLSGFAALADNGSSLSGSTAGGSKMREPVQREPEALEHLATPQVYAGEGVRLRAHQLRLSNKAISRAMMDFEKRGLQPRWDQSRTILQATLGPTGRIPGASLQRVSYPQTWIDGSYELTLITYSNSTSQWEGIVYLHNPYEDDAYSALIITPATAEWDTVYEYWYPPDGGDPTCGGGYCELQGQLNQKISQTKNWQFTNAAHTPGPLARPALFGRIKRWVKCAWNTARGAGIICEDLVCFVGAAWWAIKNC